MLGVVGAQRVTHGVLGKAVRGIPLTGRPMEGGSAIGLLRGQAGAERVGEELVVAVPLALTVERDDEQVGAVERLEHRAAVTPAGEGVAQRPGQVAQHRRVEEEAAHRLGLVAQDLLHEVVEDEPVAAGEGIHELRGVLDPPQRQAGELEPGDPPLGARLEGCHLGVVEVEPHHVGEECVCLIGREPQVRGTQLDELPAGAQPRERERRVGPRRDRETGVRWQVVDQEGHRAVHLRCLDDVVVVEDQQRPARLQVEVVHHRGQDRFGRHLGARGHELGRLGELAHDLQRGDDVLEEPRRVVVGFVEREPRDVDLRAVGQPLAEQGRLAEPCWSRHEHQPRALTHAQPIGEARPRDEVATRGRWVDLGSQHRHLTSIGVRPGRPSRYGISQAGGWLGRAAGADTARARCSDTQALRRERRPPTCWRCVAVLERPSVALLMTRQDVPCLRL